MSRQPTNTLILTNVDQCLLEQPQPLIQHLAGEKLSCELICLNKWKRILLIANSADQASEIKLFLQKTPPWTSFKISYSMRNNESAQCEVSESVDYLELPTEDGSKRFLISPPLSPPPEWDHWDKVEEHPHNKPVYNPDELTHLLWERLGGFDSSHVRRYHDPATKRDLNTEPQVLFEDVSNGCPVIMLDQVDGEEPVTVSRTLGKTSLPPT